jgi:hypothetical protein
MNQKIKVGDIVWHDNWGSYGIITDIDKYPNHYKIRLFNDNLPQEFGTNDNYVTLVSRNITKLERVIYGIPDET